MSRSLTQRVSSWGVLVAVLGLVMSPAIASAATDSEGSTVSATVGDTITVTTSTTVSFSLAPTSGGVVSSNSDTVSVSTNANGGYTLTLANADGTSNLVSGSDTFTAHTGTQASPTVLTNGTWGYAVANLDGFDASYTQETNETSSSSTWAGVPTTGNANTLKTTSETASGDETVVWYAARADTSQPAGTYTDSVTYTATTNP